MIKVFIIDDQILFLDSLALFLKQDADISIVGTATSGKQGLEKLADDPPDVVLLDLQLPDMSGLDVAETLKKSKAEVKIIILTSFDMDSDIIRAFMLGCSGYVLKDIKPADLVLTVKGVYRGLIIMHRAAQDIIGNRISLGTGYEKAEEKAFPFDTLNAQELRIIQLLCEGHSNKEIAFQLNHTEGTVKNYVSRILEKTGCKDRTQLVIHSLKQSFP